jgi:transposase
MTRLRGRCPKGQRLLSKPRLDIGRRRPSSLACDAARSPRLSTLTRRWTGASSTYVETQLAPTLQPGDVVILDNLPAHKSAAAEAAIRAKGAWFLFLPPYSPDLNPIEMAFAKLKALLRARAIRAIDALWRAIGEICDLLSPQECRNYFTATGCGFI